MNIISELPNYCLPYYHTSFPLILFYTHKAGTTSLGKWFLFQIGLLEQQDNTFTVWDKLHQYTSSTNYRERLNIYLNTKTAFKLVRNPYKRAVSSFLHTISFPYLFELFEGDFNNGLSFKSFLYQVKKMGTDKLLTDPHIAQQYIKGEESFVNNYIYMENFNDQIRKLEKKYGLIQSPLLEISKSSHHFSDVMKTEGNHSETVMSWKTKVFPFYNCFYDQETKELVLELYKSDFKVYGYEPSSYE